MTAADLPDLRGWATAAALARRLGVTAGTVRRRGARGALEVIPNPLGPGALYRDGSPVGSDRTAEAATARRTRGELRHAPIRSLTSTDRYLLTLLPATTPEVGRAAGLAPGSVERSLRRLERAGFARRSGWSPPGPRGGRPGIVWEAVSS